VDVQFSTGLPSFDLVQSVHLVCFPPSTGERVYVCRDDHGRWFLPGGTREPAESIMDCAVRELTEEAGLELVEAPVWIGAHHAEGYLDRPYRHHLPHPHKAWLWGAAIARKNGEPSNPPGAETVTEVRLAGLAEATEKLQWRGDWYGELLRLAQRAMSPAGSWTSSSIRTMEGRQ
jgi:8-oxo-dGTP diphosphatase